MKTTSTMLCMLLLALSLVLAGCQGDQGPAGSPGATGANGTNGSTGPAGPTGSSGSTGGLPNDSFQVANFHGFANSNLAAITEITSANYGKAIVNGPNNPLNPCVKINSTSIDGTGHLVVDFEVKKTVGADRVCFTADDGTYTGSILDSTIGGAALTPSFIFAQLRPGDSTGDSSYWVNYVNSTATKVAGYGTTATGTTANQPTSESHTNSVAARKGTLVDNNNQTYTYTTKAVVTDPIVIPATGLTNLKSGTFTYNNNVIRVGIQMAGANSATAYRPGAANNATYDLVPAGAPVTHREIVDVQNCNDGCHTTLMLHGGSRFDAKLCVLCHNPTNGDPESGNILDFKVFIHKIHSAKYMPSVNFDFTGDVAGTYKTNPGGAVKGTAYKIWGFGNAEFDFSDVILPANPANCQMCHKNPPGKTLADVDNWKNQPTKEACGACHDGINWTAGTGTRMWFPDSKITMSAARTDSTAFAAAIAAGHVGGPKTNADCVSCHTSSGSQGAADTDPAPIPAMHGDFTNGWSKMTTDFNVVVATDKTSYAAGEKPIVTITIYNRLADGSNGSVVDPSTITDATTSDFGSAAACTELYGLATVTSSTSLCVNKKGVTVNGLLNLYVSGPRASRKPALTTAAVWNKGFFSVGTGNIYSNAANDLRTRTATTTVSGVSYLNTPAQDDYQMTYPYATGSTSTVTPTATPTKVTGVLNRATMSTDGYIRYQLADVTGLTSGTYVAMVHVAKRSTAGVVPNAMSLGIARFNVGQTTEEARVAYGCPDCHSTTVWHDNAVNGAPGNHPARFDPDYCGNCHDYEAQQVAYSTGADGSTTAKSTYQISLDSTGAEVFTKKILSAGSGQLWKTGGNNMGFSAAPIARRVHGVHFARKGRNATGLNTGVNVKALGVTYPYEIYNNHNVSITFPQDVKNCEKCHPATVTSGTWKTKPNRIACLACHDSDSAYAHAVLQTVDATPTVATASATTTTPTAGPYNGDEIESCPVCHTAKQ